MITSLGIGSRSFLLWVGRISVRKSLNASLLATYLALLFIHPIFSPAISLLTVPTLQFFALFGLALLSRLIKISLARLGVSLSVLPTLFVLTLSHDIGRYLLVQARYSDLLILEILSEFLKDGSTALSLTSAAIMLR